MKLLVISGLSGAGKSIALQSMEDLGYYCVDNLPLTLLVDFSKQMLKSSSKSGINSIAVGIDARNVSEDLENFGHILEDIQKIDIVCEVIYLEANDREIIKRFSETRRKHPLTNTDLSLVEAIETERRMLAPIIACATLHIDTSETNVHQLRAFIKERISDRVQDELSLLFVSFGYKNGVPSDADFVFDVRCLPNPYWDPKLRAYSGRDAQIINFLQEQPIVEEMFSDISVYLEKWIKQFESENRNYLCVAIGCTGGRHRSVYLADILTKHFKKSRKNIMTRHRELA